MKIINYDAFQVTVNRSARVFNIHLTGNDCFAFLQWDLLRLFSLWICCSLSLSLYFCVAHALAYTWPQRKSRKTQKSLGLTVSKAAYESVSKCICECLCVCVFVHVCAVHVNHRPPVGGESFSKRVASAIMGYRWGNIVCCAHCVVGFC